MAEHDRKICGDTKIIYSLVAENKRTPSKDEIMKKLSPDAEQNQDHHEREGSQ